MRHFFLGAESLKHRELEEIDCISRLPAADVEGDSEERDCIDRFE